MEGEEARELVVLVCDTGNDGDADDAVGVIEGEESGAWALPAPTPESCKACGGAPGELPVLDGPLLSAGVPRPDPDPDAVVDADVHVFEYANAGRVGLCVGLRRCGCSPLPLPAPGPPYDRRLLLLFAYPPAYG